MRTIIPYILLEIGAKFKIELASFNTGADLNALSYELWVTIGKPMVTPSTTTIDSFAGDSNPIEGYLDLQIFIGNTNVGHRFYVLKPRKLALSVILDQPWQQMYNGVPNWQREGINFEIDGDPLFTPFLGEDFYPSESHTHNEMEEALSEFNQEENKD